MFQNGIKGQALTPLFFAFCFGMVLSTMLNQRPVEPKASEEPLMTYRGFDKYLDDLPSDIASELDKEYQAFLKVKQGYLEDAALRFKVLDYAEKTNSSVDQAAAELYAVESPTESDIAGFYAMHRKELGKPFFEVQESIKKRVSFQKAREKRSQVLDELRSKGDLIIHSKDM